MSAASVVIVTPPLGNTNLVTNCAYTVPAAAQPGEVDLCVTGMDGSGNICFLGKTRFTYHEDEFDRVMQIITDAGTFGSWARGNADGVLLCELVNAFKSSYSFTDSSRDIWCFERQSVFSTVAPWNSDDTFVCPHLHKPFWHNTVLDEGTCVRMFSRVSVCH